MRDSVTEAGNQQPQCRRDVEQQPHRGQQQPGIVRIVIRGHAGGFCGVCLTVPPVLGDVRGNAC